MSEGDKKYFSSAGDEIIARVIQIANSISLIFFGSLKERDAIGKINSAVESMRWHKRTSSTRRLITTNIVNHDRSALPSNSVHDLNDRASALLLPISSISPHLFLPWKNTRAAVIVHRVRCHLSSVRVATQKAIEKEEFEF